MGLKVLEKKIVCDILGKKLFVFYQGEKNVMFSCWKEKNNLVRKKNHTRTLVLNCPPLCEDVLYPIHYLGNHYSANTRH